MASYRWLISVIVTDALPSDNDLTCTESEYFVTVEEARRADVIGLPVYLDFYRQHRIGTVVKSSVVGCAWLVDVAVHVGDKLGDVGVGVKEIEQRIIDCRESKRSLHQLAYEMTSHRVACPPGTMLIKTLIQFAFVHESLVSGSGIVTIKPQQSVIACG